MFKMRSLTLNTKSIDLPLPIFLNSWEKNSFQDAVIEANNLAYSLEYGIVVLLINSREDLMQLPSTYPIYKDEDGNYLAENEYDFEINLPMKYQTEHTVPWIEDLNIENNTRLVLHYLADKDSVDVVKDYYNILWKGGL